MSVGASSIVVNFAWVFLTGSRGSLVIAALCMAFLAVRLSGAAPRLAFFARRDPIQRFDYHAR